MGSQEKSMGRQKEKNPVEEGTTFTPQKKATLQGLGDWVRREKLRLRKLVLFSLFLFVLCMGNGILVAQEGNAPGTDGVRPSDSLEKSSEAFEKRISSMALDALALAMIFLGLSLAIFGRVPPDAPVGVILCAILLVIAASAGAFEEFLKFWESLWNNAEDVLAQFMGPEKR